MSKLLLVLAWLSAAVPAQTLATLRGRVRDIGGDPIAGAEISLHLTASSWSETRSLEPIAATRSRGDGTFAIVMPERSILVDESFALVVIHRDHALVAVYGVSAWQLDTLTHDVRMAEGSPLDGQVLDEEGSPVAGAVMDVFRRQYGPRGHDYLLASARCDAAGRFAFASIDRGRDGLTVRATKPDGSRSAETHIWAHPIVLRFRKDAKTTAAPPRPSRSGGVPQLGAGAFPFEGQVVDAGTRTPITTFAVGPSLAPELPLSRPPDRILFTGADAQAGRFTIGLRAGCAAVTVYALDYAPQRVEVDRDEAPIILLHRGGTITGTIVDAQGKPIVGALVEAMPDGFAFEPLASLLAAQRRPVCPYAFTNGAGTYKIEHVPAGPHHVLAACADYAPELAGPVIVRPGTVEADRVCLDRGGRIAGTLAHADWLSLGRDLFGPIDVPVAGGRFDVGGLPTGEFKLTFGSSDACLIGTRAVHVVAGETTEVVLVRGQ